MIENDTQIRPTTARRFSPRAELRKIRKAITVRAALLLAAVAGFTFLEQRSLDQISLASMLSSLFG